MKRDFLFVLAIALALPYLAVLADDDAFDVRPNSSLDGMPHRTLHDRKTEPRDPGKGSPGDAATQQDRIDKNEAQLPDDGRSPDPNQRVWQYDRE